MKAIPGFHPTGSQRQSNFVPGKIVAPQKYPKTLPPDDAKLWLGFDFLMALAEGASCPSAKERHTLEPLRVSFSTSSLTLRSSMSQLNILRSKNQIPTTRHAKGNVVTN